MIDMGNTAFPDWATMPDVSEGGVLTAMFLAFIGLLGLIATGKGIVLAIKYFKPNAPDAPKNLWQPFFMIVFGMIALVPQRVYALLLDLLTLLGWR